MTNSELKRVLIIDDEPDIRTVARMVLETIGRLTVQTAPGGRAALSLLSDFKPQLILLDVMMPGMDGLETMQQLRAHAAGAEIPILLMTAKVQTHEVESYLKRGADDVIGKPFDPRTLCEKVHQAWQRFHHRPPDPLR